jgi:hypothetical protein
MGVAVMSEPEHEKNEDVERGYAEEQTDAPLDDVEREVSAPPEERWPEHQGNERGSAG